MGFNKIFFAVARYGIQMGSICAPYITSNIIQWYSAQYIMLLHKFQIFIQKCTAHRINVNCMLKFLYLRLKLYCMHTIKIVSLSRAPLTPSNPFPLTHLLTTHSLSMNKLYITHTFCPLYFKSKYFPYLCIYVCCVCLTRTYERA